MSMKKTTKNFLKDKDMFGHVVNLNFNGKSDSHNTLIGGSISIIIKMFVACFLVTLTKKMILSEGNDLSCEEFVIDKIEGNDHEENTVKLEESKMMIYHTVSKIRDGQKDVDYENSKQFIELRYVQRVVNFEDGKDL